MRYAVSLLVLVLSPVTVAAQSLPWKQVVPDSVAGSEGAVSTALPFGSTLARHLMYAYDGSAVGYGHPIRIAAVSLRCDGTTPGSSTAGSYTFTLDVSTSRNAVGALSTTFAQNHGADRLRVHSGVLAVPAPTTGAAPNAFSLRIPFTVPFDWDPRNGPLLLDLGYASGSPAFGSWDAVVGGVAGIFAVGATATTATNVQAVAPVIQLEVVGEVLPVGAATSEASATSSYPWGRAAGQQMRTLNLYEAAAVPFTGRQRITALAWRTDLGNAFPGRTFTVRISMSTSSKTSTSLDPTFANNHGPDLTVVFDGVLTAPATPASPDLGHFDVFCELQRPFEYDPAVGALAVDYQLFDCTGTPTNFDHTNSGIPVARISDITSATAATAGSAGQPGVAMVMALRTVPVPTAPAAFANVPNPSLNDGTSYPFGQSTAHSLQLISAAEAGITQPFIVRHLRFRPSNGEVVGGPSTYTMTIDLSHAATTPATVSSTFDANHGSNRVRVFDGQFSVPFFTRAAEDPAFPIEVKLQQPFLWSPSTAPYLVIDLRVLSRTGDAIPIESTANQSYDDARVTSTSVSSVTGTVQSIAPVVQLGGDGQNGLATNYGSGCPGINGAPITGTIGLPTLPNPDFRITIRNAIGNGAAVFFAGFAPLTVTIPGTTNCDVLHASEVGILGWTITDPAGSGSAALPLADDISMEGLVFRTQWIVLDPTANGIGLVTSDAQVMTARYF